MLPCMIQMGEIEHHKVGQQESLPEYRVGDELVSVFFFPLPFLRRSLFSVLHIRVWSIQRSAGSDDDDPLDVSETVLLSLICAPLIHTCIYVYYSPGPGSQRPD